MDKRIMTFLSIYVPTYKRPKALADCLASIEAQTDQDLEVVLIKDEIGIGIDGMYADIQNHIDEVHGDYVFVLSDDNLITDIDFVKRLKKVVDEYNPDVIVFKNEIVGILPSIWDAKPQLGHIDLSCFVVRSDIWKANADKWGKRYEGDYDFINSLWEQGYQFYWLDVVAVKAQRISRGQPE
jgi:hypothetical protein